MIENSFNITAKSVGIYNRIQDQVNKLPKVIIDQIETAEHWFHGGVRIVFKKAYGETNQITLPANLTHMSDTQGSVQVVTPDYLIVIPYDPGTKFQYSFYQEPTKN